MSIKRLLVISLILLIPPCIFAISITGGEVENPFPSEENLLKFDFTPTPTAGWKNAYLVTVDGGSEVYSYFGHSGIIIEEDGEGTFYDWGNFSFSDGFYRNFLFGLLYYSAGRAPAKWRLSHFENSDRTITILPLKLGQGAIEGIASFLSYNMQPENRTYMYHYYKDNCATRIRDIYNMATGGEFERWASGIKRNTTYRKSAGRYLDRNFPMSLLINYLEGREVDVPIDLYEESYLPEVLEYAIATYQGNESEEIYHTSGMEEEKSTDIALQTLIASSFYTILISALYLSGKRFLMRISDIISSLLAVLFTIASLVLLFMMLFTNHDVTYFNSSILLVNPLYLVYVVEGLKGKNVEKRIKLSKAILMLSFIFIALKGTMPDVYIEDNIPIILTATAFALPYFLLSLKDGSKYPPSRPKKRRCARDL